MTKTLKEYLFRRASSAFNETRPLSSQKTKKTKTQSSGGGGNIRNPETGFLDFPRKDRKALPFFNLRIKNPIPLIDKQRKRREEKRGDARLGPDRVLTQKNKARRSGGEVKTKHYWAPRLGLRRRKRNVQAIFALPKKGKNKKRKKKQGLAGWRAGGRFLSSSSSSCS